MKKEFPPAPGARRTLLHVAADWPGHVPNVAQTIAILIERGADPDAPMAEGSAPETALHGAASCNDVDALDALLDGGANIESPGAIFTNGTAMSDAVIFAQWNAARRLLDRGAKTAFTNPRDSVSSIAWSSASKKCPIQRAIRSPPRFGTPAVGQLQTARYLIAKGANINWVGWDKISPLDGVRQSGNQHLVA